MDATRWAFESLVFFFYGLGFFVLGLATAFQYRPRSEFPLTRAIWSLAGFGLFHAFHEWLLVFESLQQAVLSSSTLAGMRIVEQLLSTVSWVLLLKFGLSLLPSHGRSTAWLRRVPLLLLGGGLVVLVQAERHLRLRPWPAAAAVGELAWLDGFADFILGLPAAFLTAWALTSQAAQLRHTRLERLVGPLRTAASSFLFYGVLTAVEAVGSQLVVPVQTFQLFTVSAMIVAILRVLAIFNLETERRLEEAETQRAVLNERLRISRDLHDGVMQSVYAVGLALENVLFLLNEDAGRAREELERSMGRLNDTIQDIRGYILNLRPTRRTAGDLYASVLEVVAQFRAGVAIRVNIDFEQLRRIQLPPEQVEEVCQIVREALTNVARHSQATEVAVTAQLRWGDLVEISVWDNGRGFQPGEAHREGRQGLRNMRERAEGLGGTLDISSRRGRGTEVVLRLPLEGGVAGGAEHSRRLGG
ncbi:MAG TPA: sensor histidine kinase [Firmicutes bacterium]|nr:sensor histidine kinase [Bacillota bacterium]